MSDDLKPCPFCGKSARIWNAGTYYGAECTRLTIPCVSLPAVYLSKENAIEAWNTRPYLQELKACNDEYEALETENQAYEECMEDHRRLVREIDVIINGEAGAAKQASLCDLVAQIEGMKREMQEVPMNYLLRILDDAAKKCGIFSWQEGLRAIRLHCEIYPKPLKKDPPI